MHGGRVLGGCDTVLIEAETFFYLLLQLLPKGACGDVHEAVDPAASAGPSDKHLPQHMRHDLKAVAFD